MQHDKVALRVITFLGVAVILFGCGVIFLVYTSIGYDKIDPSTVALVSGVSTLAGAAMGALGSILASTGGRAPQPVTVENPPSNPVVTAEVAPVAASVAPAADAMPDPMGADPGPLGDAAP